MLPESPCRGALCARLVTFDAPADSGVAADHDPAELRRIRPPGHVDPFGILSQCAGRMDPEQKETAEESRRFRLLVESVKDYAIFMLDPTGKVSSWNPGAERIKGYKASEIIGQHFSKFYPRADIESGKCE